jgi:hypothetical protein
MDNDKQHKYTTHSTYTGNGGAICGRIIAEHGVEGEAAPAPQAATNPPDCDCEHVHCSNAICRSKAVSCGAIPESKRLYPAVSQAEAPRPSAPTERAIEVLADGSIKDLGPAPELKTVIRDATGEAESRPSAEEQMCVISATGDGARTWIVPASRLHDELHKAYCCCGVASWRECQTNGVIDMVTAIDDEDNWSHDYPDYQRHIYADHGEDYTLTVMYLDGMQERITTFSLRDIHEGKV